MWFVSGIDMVVANSLHRSHLVQGPTADWAEFFRQCRYDQPIEPMCHMLRTWSKAEDIEWHLWTGRPESVRQETLDWLSDHQLYPTMVRMRPVGDFRDNFELKATWLSQALHGQMRPDLIIESRRNLLQHAISLGIQTLQTTASMV